MRKGNFTFSAGLRWDHYSLLVHENAASPRLGIAWNLPSAGLLLRASYDRAFQTPAIENLLLASSNAAFQINNAGASLPVRPSRGNFYETGFSKTLFGKLRLDGTYFRRDLRNFADDSLLLNTGVNFPIAFSQANIYGFESKLEIPRWGPFTGFLSYSNLNGKGSLPIAADCFWTTARPSCSIPTTSLRLLRTSATRRMRVCERKFIPGFGWRPAQRMAAVCPWTWKAISLRACWYSNTERTW